MDFERHRSASDLLTQRDKTESHAWLWRRRPARPLRLERRTPPLAAAKRLSAAKAVGLKSQFVISSGAGHGL